MRQPTKNISLHRAVQKTLYYVVFGKEPNKECHDAKTSDQQPQEDGVMKNEMTGLEQEEMENDTPNNKTLPDENSTLLAMQQLGILTNSVLPVFLTSF